MQQVGEGMSFKLSVAGFARADTSVKGAGAAVATFHSAQQAAMHENVLLRLVLIVDVGCFQSLDQMLEAATAKANSDPSPTPHPT